MPTREIELAPYVDNYLREAVASGRFPDAGAAIADALDLMQEHEQQGEEERLAWLQAAAKKGFDELDRGEGFTFHSSEELKAHLDQMLQSIRAGKRHDTEDERLRA